MPAPMSHHDGGSDSEEQRLQCVLSKKRRGCRTDVMLGQSILHFVFPFLCRSNS